MSFLLWFCFVCVFISVLFGGVGCEISATLPGFVFLGLFLVVFCWFWVGLLVCCWFFLWFFTVFDTPVFWLVFNGFGVFVFGGFAFWRGLV